MKKLVITWLFCLSIISTNAQKLPANKALLRSTPEKEGVSSEGINSYLEAVKKNGQDLHSIMILRHGKVVTEQWFGDNGPDINHVMHSVSKTFVSTAIGFAVAENRVKVSDKVISFFPNDLPEVISPNLADLEIRDLLTMTAGHNIDPTSDIRASTGSWERLFLAKPIENKPGEKFIYNSLATYMLSAIIQKVSGEKVVDYLTPRLFRPLGISNPVWSESPTGINSGGWGLYITTEDMARLGQFYLQKGKWEGEQLLPAAWFDEAIASRINQPAVWVKAGTRAEDSDYLQGYGYQIWRCRHNAYRADGANGQFIIVIPEKDAVIALTANINPTQPQLDLVWEYILPALK
jgi:CubicO group peptidase (beta-lactamase class C family)